MWGLIWCNNKLYIFFLYCFDLQHFCSHEQASRQDSDKTWQQKTFFWHSCLHLCHTRQRWLLREHGLQVVWETVGSHMLSMLVNSGSRKCGIFLNLTPSAMLNVNAFVMDRRSLGHHCKHFAYNFMLYATIQKCGTIFFVMFWKCLPCTPRLHLFDQNTVKVNAVKNYYNLIYLFSILVYLNI